MCYVYCITNLINNKKYIGKTIYSVEKRFKEHCRDFRKYREEKRPLYNAMQKYGADNFKVETLIECSDTKLSDWEMFYIKKYDTYNNGYNATIGGDGSILYDYNLIIQEYNKGGTIKEVASKIGCCIDTVSNILHSNNIDIRIINKGSQPIKVSQYSLDGKFIREWDSITLASHWLVENGFTKNYNSGIKGKIRSCMNGKAKTAYKFIWK